MVCEFVCAFVRACVLIMMREFEKLSEWRNFNYVYSLSQTLDSNNNDIWSFTLNCACEGYLVDTSTLVVLLNVLHFHLALLRWYRVQSHLNALAPSIKSIWQPPARFSQYLPYVYFQSLQEVWNNSHIYIYKSYLDNEEWRFIAWLIFHGVHNPK